MALKNSRIDSQHRRLLARLRGVEFLLPERWMGGFQTFGSGWENVNLVNFQKKLVLHCCIVVSLDDTENENTKILKFQFVEFFGFVFMRHFHLLPRSQFSAQCIFGLVCSTTSNLLCVLPVLWHMWKWLGGWMFRCTLPNRCLIKPKRQAGKTTLGCLREGVPSNFTTLEVQFWEGHRGGGMLEFGESQTR